MGFVGDIFEGIGDAIGGIVDAIGDVFEWVGDALGGLFENPIGLLVAGAMAFFAAPAALGVIGGLAEGAAGVAAMGVETVAGGAGMMGQVLGTGSALVGGAAAFGEASALAGAAASGLTAAGSGLLEGASSGSGFLADATSAAEAAGGLTDTAAGGWGFSYGGAEALAPVSYEVPGAMNTVVQGGGGGFFDSISQAMGFGGGAGEGGGSLGGVTSFLKDNKEIIKMIGQGIEGWQKEEMEKEKLDWQKKVADQAQSNWEAVHQPYDFSAYDPGANLQAMNQQIFNSGYMSQANQLQQGGYQPQYLINDPNSGVLPNYQNMVNATYGREEQMA